MDVQKGVLISTDANGAVDAISEICLRPQSAATKTRSSFSNRTFSSGVILVQRLGNQIPSVFKTMSFVKLVRLLTMKRGNALVKSQLLCQLS
jgi:hypothetical protein